MRQVRVRGLTKVDQMFVLNMAAYTFVRMRSLGAVRPATAQKEQFGKKGLRPPEIAETKPQFPHLGKPRLLGERTKRACSLTMGISASC
jgi:hypothetical protein